MTARPFYLSSQADFLRTLQVRACSSAPQKAVVRDLDKTSCYTSRRAPGFGASRLEIIGTQMESRREEALVGLFVLVAATTGILIATVFLLSGKLGRNELISYRAYFKERRGLGTRSSGPLCGRAADSGESRRFKAIPKIPRAWKSISLSSPTCPSKRTASLPSPALPRSRTIFLGIVAGSNSALPRAGAGATLKSSRNLSALPISLPSSAAWAPNANDLISNLNARAVALQDTLNRVNDVLSDQNRANISSGLQNLRAILDEDQARDSRTAVNNLSDSSKKNRPLDGRFFTRQSRTSQCGLITSGCYHHRGSSGHPGGAHKPAPSAGFTQMCSRANSIRVANCNSPITGPINSR